MAVSGLTPQLYTRMSECFKREINLGVYHFYRADIDPIIQAKHFINSVGLTNLKNMFYEPIIDFETVTNRNVGPLQNESNMKSALPNLKKFILYIVEQTGRKPMFYTYESLLKYLNLDSFFLDNCSRLWIARYGRKPTFFKPWDKPWAYQFSDGEYSERPMWDDYFEGIGRCDANILWDEIQ